MKRITTKEVKRIAVYFLGLLILALGLILNTKANLGVSPIISIPFTIGQITGVNFAVLTFIEYIIFVVVEFLIKKDWKDLKIWLQIPLSLGFTYLMNLISQTIPDVGENLLTRISVLIIAIICTGIGAALSVNMNIVANPGDAIVKTIADACGQRMGNVKNIFDFCCVLFTLTLGFIFLRSVGGVGIGTVIAVLGVGRVIFFVNGFLQTRIYDKVL